MLNLMTVGANQIAFSDLGQNPFLTVLPRMGESEFLFVSITVMIL